MDAGNHQLLVCWRILQHLILDHVSYGGPWLTCRPIHRSIHRSILDRVSVDIRSSTGRYIGRVPTDVSTDTPIGRYTWRFTDTWPIFDRYLTDTWLILDRYLTDTWPILQRYFTSVHTRLTRDRYRSIYRSIVLVDICIGWRQNATNAFY